MINDLISHDTLFPQYLYLYWYWDSILALYLNLQYYTALSLVTDHWLLEVVGSSCVIHSDRR